MKTATTPPTVSIPLTIVNNMGVAVKVVSGTKSKQIRSKQTDTLVLDSPSDVKIFVDGKQISMVSDSDLIANGPNPLVYVNPSVQVLKSTRAANQEEPAPAGYMNRPTVNATPVPVDESEL